MTIYCRTFISSPKHKQYIYVCICHIKTHVFYCQCIKHDGVMWGSLLTQPWVSLGFIICHHNQHRRATIYIYTHTHTHIPMYIDI